MIHVHANIIIYLFSYQHNEVLSVQLALFNENNFHKVVQLLSKSLLNFERVFWRSPQISFPLFRLFKQIIKAKS